MCATYKTKNESQKNEKKLKRICSVEMVPGKKPWSQSKEGESLGWKLFVEQEGFDSGMKQRPSDR